MDNDKSQRPSEKVGNLEIKKTLVEGVPPQTNRDLSSEFTLFKDDVK
jgi:hypothetical protein